jgi:hypothetical protein
MAEQMVELLVVKSVDWRVALMVEWMAMLKVDLSVDGLVVKTVV